ncbi:MAG: ubiquinone biosynthesis regulatory protein kinase UbiB, partial [Gammaproteobacteria bacterium]|nr:ubiquinone biosynthesis regulatory protein kinase UbiB [Gammaproteobacteria bacterium]
RQLYPELDLWTTAKPFLERWMEEQVGPKAFSRKLRKNLPKMAEHAADMPLLLHKVLNDAAEQRLELNWKSEELGQLRKELKEGNRLTIAAVSGGSMLISGALLLTLGPSILLPASVVTSAGIGLSSAGGLLLIHSWLRS